MFKRFHISVAVRLWLRCYASYTCSSLQTFRDKHSSLTAWSLKIAPMCCLETSVLFRFRTQKKQSSSSSPPPSPLSMLIHPIIIFVLMERCFKKLQCVLYNVFLHVNWNSVLTFRTKFQVSVPPAVTNTKSLRVFVLSMTRKKVLMIFLIGFHIVCCLSVPTAFSILSHKGQDFRKTSDFPPQVYLKCFYSKKKSARYCNKYENFFM